MLFLLLSLVMTCGAVLEVIRNWQYKKQAFSYLLLALTLVLVLRYFQGTDYGAYWNAYYRTAPSFSEALAKPPWHMETGWVMLCVPFRMLGVSFPVFAGVVGLVCMGAMGLMIYRFSPYKLCSLLLLFPAGYMTYFFSSIRQGLVTALFLGMGIPFLLKKKKIAYYILILVLAQLHTMGYFLLVLPHMIDAWGNRRWNWWMRLGLLGGMAFVGVLGMTGLLAALGALVGQRGAYLQRNVSLGAIAVRLVYFAAVFVFHQLNRGRKNRLEELLYRVYLFGFASFMLLSFSAIISNRLTVPFKQVEILLLPLELYLFRREKGDKPMELWGFRLPRIPQLRQLAALGLLAAMLLIPNVELYKNLNAYVREGSYVEGTNALNFPYLNVFQKDRVTEYRQIEMPHNAR